MADFAIQHDIETIALDAATATITAGVNYTAPASTSAAFIRIVGVAFTGAGLENTDFISTPRNSAVKVTGDITSSITFTRVNSANGPIQISWEIIEYTGSISGANEFIVRGVADINLSGSLTGDSGAISGVVTDADVVVFQTGVTGAGSGRRDAEQIVFTTEWVGGSTVARVTRGSSSSAANATVAVVEFTGSNWKIQRVVHTYTASSTDETQTIPVALGSAAKAFLHYGLRVAGSALDPDALGQKCHISSTSQLTFYDEDIGTGAVGVAWVIENTQSTGTVMDVQQYSGTRADGAGGDPDVFTETISSVSSLSTSSVMGEGSVTVTTLPDLHRDMLIFELTSITQVTLIRARNISSRDYRFQVVEWPDVGVAPAGFKPYWAINSNISIQGGLL